MDLAKSILCLIILSISSGCSTHKLIYKDCSLDKNCISYEHGQPIMKNLTKYKKPLIGWREWVELPSLGIKEIKAKIDTGARTSSIHAVDMKFYKRGGSEYVKFKVLPKQKNNKSVVETHARVYEYRNIRSSNGQVSRRPIILSDIILLGQKWQIELALSNRDEMGFRMLLGRQSFKKKFLVDANNSFYGKKTKLK